MLPGKSLGKVKHRWIYFSHEKSTKHSRSGIAHKRLSILPCDKFWELEMPRYAFMAGPLPRAKAEFFGRRKPWKSMGSGRRRQQRGRRKGWEKRGGGNIITITIRMSCHEWCQRPRTYNVEDLVLTLTVLPVTSLLIWDCTDILFSVSLLSE